MALRDKRQFKLPRAIIAEMARNNPQAIKALENLQLDVFDLLPSEIAQIIEKAASDAMQASMIANQIRDSLAPYLQPVGVPVQSECALDAVCININDNNNYLVSV